MLAVVAAVSLLGGISPAHAVTVLYRNDGNVGTDYMAQALASMGFTTTTTDGSLSRFALSGYDIVVYANQLKSQPLGDQAALSAYIAGGGRAIYDNWTRDSQPTLNSAYTGDANLTSVTLSQFNSGIASPLTATNPGYGTFTTGLAALPGGSVAASFEDGSAAIVVGNGGRTIHNGFLADTIASAQLYQNELQSVLAITAAVPEPASWALMLIGFSAVGASLRRRRATTRVSYI